MLNLNVTYPRLFPGTYINEKEKKSYPLGTPSPGYDGTGKVISAPVVPANNSKYKFLNTGQTSSAPAVSASPTAPAATATRSKYIDPKTGTYFKTAEEYGNYVATKIPVASDVPKYAGDAMTNPDQSATALQGTARNLNNARNDIAVGATDPYKAGNESGIAYSPQELSAIEKAYAGIYDPALNDVFARLKTKADQDAAAADSKQKLELMAQQHKYDLETSAQNNAYDIALKNTPTAAESFSAIPLGIGRGTDGYVNPTEYIQKAYDYEKNGGNMSDFLKKYPPTNYINPNDQASLPAFLQPKVAAQSQTEIDNLIWQWLLSPEAANMSDTEKAQEIVNNGGGDPTKFGVYP
jgi:hypothetical protein